MGPNVLRSALPPVTSAVAGWTAGYERLALDRPAPGLLRARLPRAAVMNASLHREVARLWRDVAADGSVRAVLLAGAGGAFCAGADIEEERRDRDDRARRAAMTQEARDLVYGMLDCPQPIVTAARGAAVGAGLALLLLADVSVVAADARLADGHVRVGVAAGDHAAIIWPLLCGVAKAKYLLLAGVTFSGAEAEAMQMVSLSVPDDEVDEHALRVATRLAAGPPQALRATKRAINQWVRQAAPIFETALAAEVLGVAGPEGREGFDAFAEHRTAQW
jgi:enoyl-CoA hydratase/carnithine racemase